MKEMDGVHLLKDLLSELDPKQLQRKFLGKVLQLENVRRGSIWVREGSMFRCVEAGGPHSEIEAGFEISAEEKSIVRATYERRERVVANLQRDDRHYKAVECGFDVKSSRILAFPLNRKDGSIYGVLELIDTSPSGAHMRTNEEYIELIQEVVDVFAALLSNTIFFTEEMEKTRGLLGSKGVNLYAYPSKRFQELVRLAARFAKSDYPVLLTGESGTGKEVFAEFIHAGSPRAHKPFVAVNCSAITDNLLESELFGHKKGSFTGAVRDKEGLFEEADGGTLFLDEIGDMQPGLQARILRVLEDCTVRPVGGERKDMKTVNVRIVAATNKNLENSINADEFRRDLFYRLNVHPLHLPSLRERKEDIPELVRCFLEKESRRLQMPMKRVAKETLEVLMDRPWEGNIRELENLVKNLLITTEGNVIRPDDLPDSVLRRQEARGEPDGNAPVFQGYTWEALERDYAKYLLENNGGVVSRAARQADVHLSTFRARIKKLLGDTKPV